MGKTISENQMHSYPVLFQMIAYPLLLQLPIGISLPNLYFVISDDTVQFKFNK